MLELTTTDFRMTELSGGSITPHGDFHAVRTPNNPGYYHGNYLFLPSPPNDLEAWVKAVETTLATDHVCLRWDGNVLSDPELNAAARAGFVPDHGIAMELTAVGQVTKRSDLIIRPLAYPGEWETMAALSDVCNPSPNDNEHHRLFLERMRRARESWVAKGAAIWWGAFDGDEVVGACGLVDCGEIGRFQEVETHPDHRRQGVCTTLVATVAEDALKRHRAVLLGAEPDGPALGLYRRLGFREVGWQRSLLRGATALEVRPETKNDHAGVYTMVAAAFGQANEPDLIERLRDVPGVISLVAVRSGKLLGHAFFTPVRVEQPDGDWDAIALGPMAVRPGYQRSGIGTALIEAGLDACRQAGFPACIVLGHPAYYPRFGFEPAHTRGLRSTFEVPPEVFMVMELSPGALTGRSGLVRYHHAFNEV